MNEILLGLTIGIISSIFTSFVSGGAGLVTAPLLFFLGIPPYMAVATPKVGALGIALGSITRFWKTNFIIWKYIPILVPVSILASFLGVELLLSVPEQYVKTIIALLILFAVALTFLRKGAGIENIEKSKIMRGVGYVVYTIVETIRAAFGSGVGILRTLTLVHFHGLSVLESTATGRVAGVTVALITSIMFFAKGVIIIPLAVGILAGDIIGSYVGTHYAIKLGNEWVRTILLVSAIVMAIILLVT